MRTMGYVAVWTLVAFALAYLLGAFIRSQVAQQLPL